MLKKGAPSYYANINFQVVVIMFDILFLKLVYKRGWALSNL